jgi:hypothetical protein
VPVFGGITFCASHHAWKFARATLKVGSRPGRQQATSAPMPPSNTVADKKARPFAAAMEPSRSAVPGSPVASTITSAAPGEDLSLLNGSESCPDAPDTATNGTRSQIAEPKGLAQQFRPTATRKRHISGLGRSSMARFVRSMFTTTHELLRMLIASLAKLGGFGSAYVR